MKFSRYISPLAGTSGIWPDLRDTALKARTGPLLSGSPFGQSSKSERVTESHRGLRGLRLERRAGDQSVLSQGDEDFVAELIFPTVAR